jgi:DNA-directed RNA polymerase
MDASHLMMTVNAAATKGIGAFSLIHDSFGCHAGYAHELAICLREQFLRMYTEFDVLGGLAGRLRGRGSGEGAELPPATVSALWTSSQVRQSQYFFA